MFRITNFTMFSLALLQTREGSLSKVTDQINEISATSILNDEGIDFCPP